MNDNNQSFEEYVKQLLEEGYIGANGQPLKCLFCESTDLENRNEYYENSYIIEFQVFCKSCHKQTGHWYYGNWDI